MCLATKTIIDSKGEDPVRTFELLAKWRNRDRIGADLEWTRLTPWREPIANIFDNPARENKFSSFRKIEIVHGGEKPGASALYAAGWLSAPYKAEVTFTKASDQGDRSGARLESPSGIHCITLHSDSERIDFERNGECMTLRSTNGRERRYSYKDASVDTLMTEELAVIGNDPAFDSAFTRAQELLNG